MSSLSLSSSTLSVSAPGSAASGFAPLRPVNHTVGWSTVTVANPSHASSPSPAPAGPPAGTFVIDDEGASNGTALYSDAYNASSSVLHDGIFKRHAYDQVPPVTHLNSPQHPAPHYLTKLSTKGGEHYARMVTEQQYHFPESAGTGVTIIIIDSGLNAAHPEVQKYEHLTGHKVIYKEANDHAKANTDTSKTGHGSCVWQHALSPTYGAAKKAQSVVINFLEKSDRRTPAEKADGSPSEQELSQCKSLEIAEETVREMKAKHPKEKFIINISHAYGFKECAKKTIDQSFADFAEEKDVLVIFSAGNLGILDRPVPDHKCKWQAEHDNILIIGASDHRDHVADITNKDPKCVIDAYAEASEVYCFNPHGAGFHQENGADKKTEGTSFAAPQIAGIAATIWADKGYHSAKEVRDHVRKLAHHRVTGGAKIGYNGYDAATCKFDKRALALSRRAKTHNSNRPAAGHNAPHNGHAGHNAPAAAAGQCDFRGKSPVEGGKHEHGKPAHEHGAPAHGHAAHNAGKGAEKHH